MEEKDFLLIKNAGGEKGANNLGIGVPLPNFGQYSFSGTLP